jgi:hypothetical protein
LRSNLHAASTRSWHRGATLRCSEMACEGRADAQVPFGRGASALTLRRRLIRFTGYLRRRSRTDVEFRSNSDHRRFTQALALWRLKCNGELAVSVVEDGLSQRMMGDVTANLPHSSDEPLRKSRLFGKTRRIGIATSRLFDSAKSRQIDREAIAIPKKCGLQTTVSICLLGLVDRPPYKLAAWNLRDGSPVTYVASSKPRPKKAR